VLDENLALEVEGITKFHEFVSVARIAVFAAELAAAIGVDGPGKRHSRAIASRQETSRRKIEVLDPALGLNERALCREASNSDKLRHPIIFALYSPRVKYIIIYYLYLC
jgi:hypothetical protein